MLRELEPAVEAAGGHMVAETHARSAPEPSADVTDAGAGIAPSEADAHPYIGDPTLSEPALYDVTPPVRPQAHPGAAHIAVVNQTEVGGSDPFDRPNVVANPVDLLAGHDGGQSISGHRSTSAAVNLSDWSTVALKPLHGVTGPDGGLPGSDTPSTPAAVHLSGPAPQSRGSAQSTADTQMMSGAPNLSDPAIEEPSSEWNVLDRGGGQGSSATLSGCAPAKKTRRAVHAAKPEPDALGGGDGHVDHGNHPNLAVAKPSRSANHAAKTKAALPDGGDGLLIADTQSPSAVAAIVDLWRQRVDLKRAAGRLNLQALATCRRLLGGDKEAAQKAWGLIKKGKGDDTLATIVEPYRAAMSGLAASAHALEKQLTKIVRKHPLWAWAAGVRGLGEVSLAGLIGEASGNLGDYRSVSALWKRMGLAVIDGERQRRVANAEQALLHGYAPQRRAFAYVVSCNLMKSQKAEDEYRRVYDRRKAYELERDIAKAHAHNRALRVMVKELLKDAWAADRRLRNIAAQEALAA